MDSWPYSRERSRSVAFRISTVAPVGGEGEGGGEGICCSPWPFPHPSLAGHHSNTLRLTNFDFKKK